MKAFAFALLFVVAVAYAGDAPEPPARPDPLAEPQLRIFTIPPREPEMGIPVIPQIPAPRTTPAARYWICPKDETMLRVVTPNHKGEFECPVDGTVMKPAAGRPPAYFLLNEKPAN